MDVGRGKRRGRLRRGVYAAGPGGMKMQMQMQDARKRSRLREMSHQGRKACKCCGGGSEEKKGGGWSDGGERDEAGHSGERGRGRCTRG
jgi:hypothetical protein